MRNVANSVTVVTTDGPAGRHGATVSSFCSVSADPPTLLVCLNREGRTCSAALENQRFCVNVLAETDAAKARLFAGLGVSEDVDPFKEVDWSNHKTGLPVLEGTTAFSCRLTQTVLATSHQVLIGDVEAIAPGNNRPLIYMNRQFSRIADS